MRQTLSQNRIFLVPYAIIFCAACMVIAFTDKVQLHLYFNSLLQPTFSFFFKYFTFLGDGIFVISIAALIIIFNVRMGLTTLLAYGMSAGFTQGIKYAFFGDADRPQLYFEKIYVPLQVVPDLLEEQHLHHSFPSGHTTAAFALFFCLSFLSEKMSSKIFFFFMALTVAFSRVYLSQHFFEDITAGSFVAVFFSTIVCWFFYHSKVANKFNKLDKPIYKVFG